MLTDKDDHADITEIWFALSSTKTRKPVPAEAKNNPADSKSNTLIAHSFSNVEQSEIHCYTDTLLAPPARTRQPTTTNHPTSIPQIFVKDTEGKSRSFDVSPNDLIASLKSRIEYCQGIPTKWKRLVCASRQLSDAETFANYNILKKSTLQLLLRLPGGLKDRSSVQTNASSEVENHTRMPHGGTNILETSSLQHT